MAIALWGVLGGGSLARAADDGCSIAHRRPGGGPHKVRLVLPEAIAATPASHAQVTAGVAAVGARLLDDDGLVVRATDAQLDALAARLTGVYQSPAEQVRAWFQYADEIDVLEGAGWWVDTATTRPDELPVPPGWSLATASTRPVYWLVHFAAPMSQSVAVDWIAGLPGDVAVLEARDTFAIARMAAAQARHVRRLPAVDWVGRYEAVLKLGLGVGAFDVCQPGRAGAARLLRAAEDRPREQVTLEVSVFGSSPALARAIEAAGGKVSEDGDHSLQVTGPRRLIRWLARREEVRSVDVAPAIRTVFP